MSKPANQKGINRIVNLISMPKPKFNSKIKFDKRGKLIKVPTASGEHIALKLTKAKEPLPGNPVLLFVHGDGETIDDYFSYQSYFIRHGVAFCIMDHRGVGYGEGEYQTSGIRETDDCITAINYLKENGFEKISFFGRSLGGICGIYVASKVPDLVCLALDSPVIDLKEYVFYFASKFYNLSPQKVEELYPIACEKLKEKTGIDFLNVEQPSEAAKKITQPIFVIHGQNDISVPISNSEKLMQIVQSKEKKFEPFKGTHCSFRHSQFLDLFLFVLKHNGVDIDDFDSEDENDDEDIDDFSQEEEEEEDDN